MALHVPLVRQAWQLVTSEKEIGTDRNKWKTAVDLSAENIVLRSISNIRAPTTEKLWHWRKQKGNEDLQQKRLMGLFSAVQK